MALVFIISHGSSIILYKKKEVISTEPDDIISLRAHFEKQTKMGITDQERSRFKCSKAH